MDAFKVLNPKARESGTATDTLGQRLALCAAHTTRATRGVGAPTLFATQGVPRRSALGLVGKGRGGRIRWRRRHRETVGSRLLGTRELLPLDVMRKGGGGSRADRVCRGLQGSGITMRVRRTRVGIRLGYAVWGSSGLLGVTW